MNKIILVTAFLTLGIVNGYTQTEDNPCSIMYNGTFLYGKRLDHIVVIKDNIKTEDWGFKNFSITSQIVWVNDCEYNSTILKVSEPKFKYNIGDRLNVKITHVSGNNIYYTASRNGFCWDGHFVKKK